MSPRSPHRRGKSQIDRRDERGVHWFRSTCTCGWVSSPIGPEHVVSAWERHVDAVRSPATRSVSPTQAGSGLRIEVLDTGDPARVRIAGELGIAAQGPLMRELKPLCATEPRTTLLDVAAVGFVDSMGLGAIVAAKNWAVSAGGEFVLVAPSAQLRRLLSVTGLGGHISVQG